MKNQLLLLSLFLSNLARGQSWEEPVPDFDWNTFQTGEFFTALILTVLAILAGTVIKQKQFKGSYGLGNFIIVVSVLVGGAWIIRPLFELAGYIIFTGVIVYGAYYIYNDKIKKG
ncbi:hypothetical protein GYB22_08330 [bacterium]|nr:hypothetical protein [bacterium]